MQTNVVISWWWLWKLYHYQTRFWKIMYPIVIRPDISFVGCAKSQFMEKSKKYYMQSILRISHLSILPTNTISLNYFTMYSYISAQIPVKIRF